MWTLGLDSSIVGNSLIPVGLLSSLCRWSKIFINQIQVQFLSLSRPYVSSGCSCLLLTLKLRNRYSTSPFIETICYWKTARSLGNTRCSCLLLNGNKILFITLMNSFGLKEDQTCKDISPRFEATWVCIPKNELGCTAWRGRRRPPTRLIADCSNPVTLRKVSLRLSEILSISRRPFYLSMSQHST